MAQKDCCPDYILVQTQKQLEEMASAAADCTLLACDVEVDTLYHYGESLCLIQLSDGKRIWLIDTLSLKDLSCLAGILKDETKEKIFHGADFDLRSIKKHLGISCRNVFDTYLASRYLGEVSSLSGLVKKYFGVSLEKRFQLADWTKRPLPEQMCLYAANDVFWLPRLSEKLKERLLRLRRWDWVKEECEILTKKDLTEKKNQPLFLRFPGAGNLSRRKLAVLESILQWRESLAREKDCPPFKILGNQQIKEILNQVPGTKEFCRRKWFLNKGDVFRQTLLQAVETGLNLPGRQCPVYPGSLRFHRWLWDLEVEEREKLLLVWRQSMGMIFSLEPSLILTRKQVREIAERAPVFIPELKKIPGLRQWQKKNFGPQICFLMRKTVSREKKGGR